MCSIFLFNKCFFILPKKIIWIEDKLGFTIITKGLSCTYPKLRETIQKIYRIRREQNRKE